ncbi:MAG: hypothetical protein AVDCRST_MAG53-683, partial [uncultured Solirubrobacteraceae bacterium]
VAPHPHGSHRAYDPRRVDPRRPRRRRGCRHRLPDRARPRLLRDGHHGRRTRRAGQAAAGRRRPRDHAPADRRRL